MNVGVGRRILLWGVGVLMALVAAVPSAGYAAMPQSAFAVPGCSIVVNKPSVGTRKINNQSVSVVIGYVQVNCNTTQSQITINRTIQKSQGNQVLTPIQPNLRIPAIKLSGVVLKFGIPIRQAHGKPLVRQAIPIM